jgi:hypothetical protein
VQAFVFDKFIYPKNRSLEAAENYSTDLFTGNCYPGAGKTECRGSAPTNQLIGAAAGNAWEHSSAEDCRIARVSHTGVGGTATAAHPEMSEPVKTEELQ